MSNRQLKVPAILLLSLTVSSCELMGPSLHEKLPLESVEKIKASEKPEVIYQELSNEESAKNQQNASKVELYPGNGQFMSNHTHSRFSKTKSGAGEYSLNFDQADLGEVVKVVLTDILGENYVLSPKVTGSVTLQTTQPLSRAELLPTLEMLLQHNDAAMVYANGLFQIKPAAEVLTGSPVSAYNSRNKKIPAGYQVRVVPVRNVAADELSQIIRPLLQAKTILHVDSNRNMMLVAGTEGEIARAMEMVHIFDVDVMKGKSFGMFPLRNVNAAKMIAELDQVFNNTGGKSGKGLFQFIEIERLNAILAITHRAKNLKKIERWIFRLDKANTSSGGGAIVYRVQNVDAVELAATLSEIFGQSGSKKGKAASIAPGKKAIQVTNKERSKKPEPKSPNKLKVASSTPGISDLGEVKIIADEVNNALIIVATAQDYAVVQKVIQQLDVMPLQVLIDATIVDVTLTDNLAYGIKWFLSHNNGGEQAASSNSGISLTDVASAAAAASTGGFGYAFVSDSSDISAVLDAQASKGNINVVSSPSLMVLNNQEASIQVGNEISLRVAENTPLNSGTGTNNDLVSTNQLQQRKTGVKLRVKPRVNASGLVIMEIEQSVEDPGAIGTDGNNPDILTREISSIVAVQSGETIVLGGLIRENTSLSKSGVPILHELPLIGPLFGSTNKVKEKTELVVLITPRVVKSRYDARLVTNEFKRKLSDIYEEEIDVIQE